MMDFEEELKKQLFQREEHVFKRNGELTLDRTYVPDKIQHRDDVLKKLASDFKVVFKDAKSVNIAIRGGGGFGKTMISKFLQEKLASVATDLGVEFDSRYYNCFQFRTMGSILRDYMPENLYISGRGFSIAELNMFLIKNLQRDNKKLLLVIDEIQNLKPGELMALLSINEEHAVQEGGGEFISTILIARSSDWDATLSIEPRVAQRLQSTIELPKYSLDQLVDIFAHRRELAFIEGALSDENVEVIADMSELSGNVYYGIELMHHAGKMAEQNGESEILPEMIRHAASYVSTEFREPVLQELKVHEQLALLAIARVLERKNKVNVNSTFTVEVYEEYKLVCEEFSNLQQKPHAITVFRKHIRKLNQSRLIRERPRNMHDKGRHNEIHMIDFPAELVRQKVEEILEAGT